MTPLCSVCFGGDRLKVGTCDECGMTYPRSITAWNRRPSSAGAEPEVVEAAQRIMERHAEQEKRGLSYADDQVIVARALLSDVPRDGKAEDDQ